MQVRDVMTPDPKCCTADTTLEWVAGLMVSHDCGEIPVVDNVASMKPIGVITDRDITCRTVAKGLNPLTMTVSECMTTPCITVTPDTNVDECCRLMEEKQIRRVPVVDEDGSCCGILALADIAKTLPKGKVAGVVREVSESSALSSSAGGS